MSRAIFVAPVAVRVDQNGRGEEEKIIKCGIPGVQGGASGQGRGGGSGRARPFANGGR